MTRLIPIALMSLLGLVGVAAGPVSAGQYDPGASDTTINIGQTYPYSGPDSGASSGARSMTAYFAMLNDKGESTAGRSISTALTMATARPRPSNKRGAWSNLTAFF